MVRGHNIDNYKILQFTHAKTYINVKIIHLCLTMNPSLIPMSIILFNVY